MSELPVRRDADDSTAAGAADVDAAATRTAPALDAGPDGVYAAIVSTYDDAPDECTVFPVEVSEADLVTTWVSAREGSFVPLAEMR
jgi:hypothetical protein